MAGRAAEENDVSEGRRVLGRWTDSKEARREPWRTGTCANVRHASASHHQALRTLIPWRRRRMDYSRENENEAQVAIQKY